MKRKKAGKRLEQIEALLSDVMEGYAMAQPQVRELLASAKNSVMLAQAALQQALVEEGREEEPLVELETATPQTMASGRKRAQKSAPAPKV